MKNCKSQALKSSDHFKELSWAFLGQYFKVGMSVDHGDFNVSGGPLGVSNGRVMGRVVVVLGLGCGTS